jgi:hypothetical protein
MNATILLIVIPANAGIQGLREGMDTGFRRYDGLRSQHLVLH